MAGQQVRLGHPLPTGCLDDLLGLPDEASAEQCMHAAAQCTASFIGPTVRRDVEAGLHVGRGPSTHLHEGCSLKHRGIKDVVGFEECGMEGDRHEGRLGAVDATQHQLQASGLGAGGTCGSFGSGRNQEQRCQVLMGGSSQDKRLGACGQSEGLLSS